MELARMLLCLPSPPRKVFWVICVDFAALKNRQPINIRPALALATLIGSSSVTCSRLCHWTTSTSAKWLLFPVLRKLGLEAPFSFSRRNKTQIATRWRCLSLINDAGLLSVLGGRESTPFPRSTSRSEKQTDPTYELGGIPSTGCLYPEVVLKEYIEFGCQCSKAPRQKIPFQKKVLLMKPHKSRRAGATSGITPHKSQTPKPRSLSPVPISMTLKPFASSFLLCHLVNARIPKSKTGGILNRTPRCSWLQAWAWSFSLSSSLRFPKTERLAQTQSHCLCHQSQVWIFT